MPMQQQKASLLGKLGNIGGVLKRAVEAPIDYGRQGPPPGIRNGVAQVVECKFEEYKTGDNTGKPYFTMRANVCEPFSVIFEGQELRAVGSITTLRAIPIFDTRDSKGVVTTRDEHLAEVVNEMKKVTSEEYIRGKNPQTGEDLERIAEEIKREAPYTRFSTTKRAAREYIDQKTKQKKMSEEGVWENWNGNKGLENYTPPDPSERVTQDDSGGSTNGHYEDPGNADGAADDAGHDDVSDEQQDDTAAGSEIDWEALVAAAEGMGTAAQKRLMALASEAGVPDDKVESATSWQEVADLIQGASGEQGDASEAAEEPEPEATPEPEPVKKGSVVKWHDYVVDPKNKGKLLRAKKATEHEVVQISKAGDKVCLKNTTTGRIVTDPATNKSRWVPLSECESV